MAAQGPEVGVVVVHICHQSEAITAREIRAILHPRLPEGVEVIGCPAPVGQLRLQIAVEQSVGHPVEHAEIVSRDQPSNDEVSFLPG